MSHTARKITESRLFQAGILTTIVGAGVLAGLGTDPAIVAAHGSLLDALD
ncbi:MAG: hypothetical protein RLZZ522_159, partial [Verrucomicrobiota bacterium]